MTLLLDLVGESLVHRRLHVNSDIVRVNIVVAHIQIVVTVHLLDDVLNFSAYLHSLHGGSSVMTELLVVEYSDSSLLSRMQNAIDKSFQAALSLHQSCEYSSHVLMLINLIAL